MSDSDVRVLIADDHSVYRDGVARATSERPGLELVGVASDGRAAMAAIRDLRLVVRHHHERWDGTGYPDGLAGAGIAIGRGSSAPRTPTRR